MTRNSVCVAEARPSLSTALMRLQRVKDILTDPIAMLARCAEFVRDDSVIYIEVPDGEEAIKDSPDRQVFFIVHLHIFSMTSLAMMIDRAGFRALRIEHRSAGYHPRLLRLRPQAFLLDAMMLFSPFHNSQLATISKPVT